MTISVQKTIFDCQKFIGMFHKNVLFPISNTYPLHLEYPLLCGTNDYKLLKCHKQTIDYFFFQLRTVPLGLDNIILPSEEAQRKAFEAANKADHLIGPGGDASSRKWRRGELEFEALMRRLENAVSVFC